MANAIGAPLDTRLKRGQLPKPVWPTRCVKGRSSAAAAILPAASVAN